MNKINDMLMNNVFLAKKWTAAKDFNSDRWFDKVVSFATGYVFGFIGIIVFVTCVVVGFSTMIAEYNPNPAGVHYQNKKRMFFAIVGAVIVVSALAITTLINSLVAG